MPILWTRSPAYYDSLMTTHPRAAVILCGSGRADGSEIHEATSILIHLSRLGSTYHCFAPDRDQAEVINHLTGKPQAEKRNCLVESARIARGDVKPLAQLKPADFDCLLFPGGFGAAKNLCTFAKDGKDMTVHPDVQRIFDEFHTAGKPIGLCCIAPVIAAKLLKGVNVTIGDDQAVSGVITSWGGKNTVVPCEVAVTDQEQRIATSPAYMYGAATPWQVYQGIGKMVEQTIAMCKPALQAA
jgi:enhancing lycopene biosynthesis protein 2